MDNNNGNDNQFGYSGGDGGYAPPESSYNPDAQYGFSSAQTGGANGAQQNAADQSGTFNSTQGGYNLNGQYTSTSGSYNANQDPYGGSTFQNSSGQYNAGPNQNPYGGYNYSNGNYNMNQGNVPLDKHGQPMKNNFAMKLTFSIIEMVIGLLLSISGAMCFGIIPLVLAVIACVMVCMQNKHYKEGSWNSFVSAKKASTALLWVAFAFYMVFLVLVIVVVILALVVGVSILEYGDLGLDALDELQNRYESGSDYEYDDVDDLIDSLPDLNGSGDSADGGDYHTISGDNLYIDGFNEFTLNGSRLALPMDLSDFVAAGFLLKEEDMEAVIEANNSDGYSYFDSDGNYLGTLFVYNVTDEDIYASDGIAAGITINNYGGVVLEMVNGITFDTSADEAVAALGDPTGASGKNGSVYLEWYMNDRYGSSLELDYMSGQMSEVWIMNYLPLEE